MTREDVFHAEPHRRKPAKELSASEAEGDQMPGGKLTGGVVGILLSGDGRREAARDQGCGYPLIAGSRGMVGVSIAG